MTWKALRQAFKNKDMRTRLFVVFALIILFRVLSHVPIPLAEPTQLRTLLDNVLDSQQLLGFLDLISGGALSSFSIMLMGLGPYINASIIMQLLTRAIPSLDSLNKEGEHGRRKINQYTRLLTLPLALMQSIGLIFLIRQQANAQAGIDITAQADILRWGLMITTLVGGSMLIMWLGELMSEQGVGNGISLLIFAGIVSQLPSIIGSLISSITGGGVSLDVFGLFSLPINGEGLLFAAGLSAVAILTTYFVVKLNEAQRIITVSYAKRVQGNRAYGGVNTVLPIKLLTAGVIPIIFAAAFLAVPSFLGQLLINADSALLADIGDKLNRWFALPGSSSAGGAGTFTGNPTDWIYPGVYFSLVVVFTYFYTNLMFSSKDISENLQKQGGFIAGIRPGKKTEAYLGRIVNRLTLFGSIALGLLAISPFLLDAIAVLIYDAPLTQNLTLGGTGLLIVVSVALETLRQVESRALMVTYESPE